MSGLLNRDALLRRMGGLKTREVALSDGAVVVMVEPTTKDIRAWRKSMRKPDGSIDPAKSARTSELLVGRLIVDPETKQRMFTEADVIGGVFDNLPSQDMQIMSRAADQLAGFIESEASPKNFDETPPSTPSGDSLAEPG